MPSTRSGLLGPRFADALCFATRLHHDDTRKGKSTPYVAHLLAVCALVLQDGGTEDEAIAALLHDAIEDHPEEVTPGQLEERFGSTVREIVLSCTDTPTTYRGGEKPPWRARKEAYLRHLIGASRGARRVALADKLSNLRELLSDLAIDGEGVWARFNAGRDEQTWYYGRILEIFSQAGHGGAMLSEYERAVEELMRAAESKQRLRSFGSQEQPRHVKDEP